MLKFENIEVVGLEHAIRGMRNPMNSWDKSDSQQCGTCGDCENCMDFCCCPFDYDYKKVLVGPNDLSLMQKLIKGGTEHSKFRRMIVVYMDITGPLYWWKEFDTYKVGTVANSCSTMHKITDKPFTDLDFSIGHMSLETNDYMLKLIETLNKNRIKYIETKDKHYWWQMIQLLPSSYNQKRTVMMNYEVLANICKPSSRRNHKLDEWSVDFIKMVEKLPYSKELIFGEG